MAAPAKLSPRAIAGRLIQAVAIVVFVGLCASALYGFVFLPPPRAANGTRLPMGLPVGLVVYGAGLTLLWAFGRGLRDPERFGRVALTQARFRHIVEAEGPALDALPSEASDDFNYPRLSGDELCGVYDSIDRQVAPERFAALLREIHRRSLAETTAAEPGPEA